MALGYLYEHLETGSPGTEAAASSSFSTKKLYSPIISAKPNLNPSHLDRSDELRNLNQPPTLLVDSFDPEASDYECRMYPDVLGFRLAHIFGLPTTTTGDGIITDPDTVAVPVGAYRHVWTATSILPVGAAPQTVEQTYAYTDQGVYFKKRGVACTELNISNDDAGGSKLTWEGPALWLDDISDPGLTAAFESLAIKPFSRRHLTLPSWLSGTGNPDDFELTLTNPAEPYRSMGVASGFPDKMEKTDDLPRVTGSISKRQLDVDDWNALVAATAFSATARYVSESIIASGYPYKFYVQMPNCQYSGGEIAQLDNVRNRGAEFPFVATTPSASAAWTLTLVNATASYS